MKGIRLFNLFCGILLAMSLAATRVAAGVGENEVEKNLAYGVIQPELLEVAYAGTERFRYEIAYTGGIKLGELEMEMRPVADRTEDFELYVQVSTADSIFDTLYPVHDTHLTRVRGRERLPYLYEVHQQEGLRYKAHKLTEYDQQLGRISYRKNDRAPVIYEVAPSVHNEFSAFMASRLMAFTVDGSFLVPTFADKRRTDVEVKVLEKVRLEKTVLGAVNVYKVTPILKFKGLYDKRGDTTIWYTDDECRVPVRISSKLAIGSVTATLLSYANPRCRQYTAGGSGEGENR